MNIFAILSLFLVQFTAISAYATTTLWCYRCVSTHPGCGEDFNWLWYWSKPCPEPDDKCVKVVERKGGEELITRDCLSALRGHRTDIPADQYEGCRSSAKDVHLANYVNNTIKELDVRRDYYDSVKFCFCFFDNRCNGASSIFNTPLVMVGSIFLCLMSYLLCR